MEDDSRQAPSGPVEQAVSPAGERTSPGLDRRKFIGALGGAAAAAAFLGSQGAAGSGQGANPPPILYQDSFGDIGPANPAALAAGIVPPPVPSQASAAAGSGTTFVTQGYAQPNILMIMVDQMGTPRWLPQGGQNAIDLILPNISGLRKTSCVFPNYFPACSACTPSRVSMLTGLYSQQTCMFNTLENPGEPELLAYAGPLPPNGSGTGFPTIGNVLSNVGYDTVWLGKWHASATGAKNDGAFSPGPGDAKGYGFNDTHCIPTNTPTQFYNPQGQPLAYPSPDGSAANEGCGGGLLGPVPGDGSPLLNGTTYVCRDYGPACPGLTFTDTGYLALGDGGIADAFGTWFSYAQLHVTKPWFCAVSFVNPHDMSGFPYSYGLAGIADPNGLGNFSYASAGLVGYCPPFTDGYTPLKPQGVDETIMAMPSPLPYPPNGAPPTGPNNPLWNNPDDPSQQPYGPTNDVYGKPTLQWAYQHKQAVELGAALNQNAWFTFLNHYLWMQRNVDYQIGRVLTALNNLPNTIIIFLSDHGDYAGSHSIHGKAWGLYEESINAPLYIKFPGQLRNPVLQYACSSVDILPFLYWAALGNNSWRSSAGDLVAYLWNREAINDFVFNPSPIQRRASTIPSADQSSGNHNKLQPYVLHTTDEGFLPVTDPSDPTGKTLVPSHAIAFRTVDVAPGAVAPYGGGKLGMYSYWNYSQTGGVQCGPNFILPTQPDTCAVPPGGLGPQFEFYNYSPIQPQPPDNLQLPTPVARYGETGNQVQFDSSGNMAGVSGMYQTNFGLANVQNELYTFTTYNGSPAPQYIIGPSGAYSTALATYLAYVKAAQAGQTPAETTWQK
jgi:hypothetical protein